MRIGVSAMRGHDGIDTNSRALTRDGIVSTGDRVDGGAEGVADLIENNELDGVLVADPFQRHAGDVGSKHLLVEVRHEVAYDSVASKSVNEYLTIVWLQLQVGLKSITQAIT